MNVSATALLAGTLLLLAACGGGAAKSSANFYAGKTITLLAGSSPGGGTDTVNRVVARHLGQFIPGSPQVIVENVDGAGGMVALNRVATAKPDGLTWDGSNSATLLYAQLQGQEQVRYDLTQLTWVGNAFQDSDALWVRSATPFADLDSVKKAATPPKLGGQAATHTSVVTPKLVQELTGLKFNIVVGYPGSPEIFLDVERGVLDGRFASYASLKTQRPDWVGNGFVRFLMYVGHQRSPDLPNVPTLDEVTPPDKQNQLALVYSSYVMTRAMVGPAGVPPELARTMQDAYAQMAKDPAFIADVAKTGFESGYAGAQELHDSVAKVLSDADMKALLLRVLSQK
ncbi:MAG TPA: tripartite tricarboxylate transporter substrate-binding protein [Chloroflexota bacterium]